MVSESDHSVERAERDGGGPIGEPSDFLERNPAWKRDVLGCFSSTDGSGGDGIGDEFSSWIIESGTCIENTG